MKSQKGITLIALVITIIVMLILVGVSISMAVNGGLFNYASEATKGTSNAITAENEIGKGMVTVDDKPATDINSLVDSYIKTSPASGN